MSSNDKKLIIFEDDCKDIKGLGEKHFIKFTDCDRRYATFYCPVIAPRHLNEYIIQNGYEVGYEVKDLTVLDNYESIIYTFTKKEEEIYQVSKGIELDKKRILLVDRGMNINLNYPKYYYEMNENGFKIEKILDEEIINSYCYVADEDEVTDELKKVMLPVLESAPGFLSINSYPFIPTRKYLKRRKKHM